MREEEGMTFLERLYLFNPEMKLSKLYFYIFLTFLQNIFRIFFTSNTALFL